MAIYVLIILCMWTLMGLLQLIKSVATTDGDFPDFVIGIIVLVSGILGIIFQSISL